tara:strand:+ start:2182 stop:4182 length:2001 start_codon:yes stop_codon:yes gene_type:complete
MSINDKLKTGFDHDTSNENDLNGQVKDYLNLKFPLNKGSLNDALYNEAGTAGTNQGDSILSLNDRLKRYFAGSSINDGIKNWVGVNYDPSSDTTPPVLLSDISINEVGENHIIYSFSMNENGTAHAVLLPNDATEPSVNQVIAGTDSGDVSLADNLVKVIDVTSVSQNNIIFEGLTVGTSYDLYLAIQDDQDNISTILYSQLTATTLTNDDNDNTGDTDNNDTVAPEFIPDQFGNSIYLHSTPSDTVIRILCQINELGNVYGIAVPNGSTAPTSAQVKAGSNYGSVTVADSSSVLNVTSTTLVNINFTGLSANTSYDIYVTAEDAQDNLMSNSASLTNISTATAVSFSNDYSFSNELGGMGFLPYITSNSDHLTNNQHTCSVWIKSIGGFFRPYSYGVKDSSGSASFRKGFNGSILDQNANYFHLIIFDAGSSLYVGLTKAGTSAGENNSLITYQDLETNYNMPNIIYDWFNLIVTYDESEFKIYLNGVLALTHTISEVYRPNPSVAVNRQVYTGLAGNSLFSNSQDNLISNNTDSGAPTRFDEFCVWNGALDQSNITAIYNSGTPFNLSSDSGNYNQSSSIYKYSGLSSWIPFFINGEMHVKNNTANIYGTGSFYYKYNGNNLSPIVNDTPNSPINRYNRSNNTGAKAVNPTARQSNTFQSGGTP